jgi:hypothetical protein
MINKDVINETIKELIKEEEENKIKLRLLRGEIELLEIAAHKLVHANHDLEGTCVILRRLV